eukprot:4387915-Prymnesium_polylepis.1
MRCARRVSKWGGPISQLSQSRSINSNSSRAFNTGHVRTAAEGLSQARDTVREPFAHLPRSSFSARNLSSHPASSVPHGIPPLHLSRALRVRRQHVEEHVAATARVRYHVLEMHVKLGDNTTGLLHQRAPRGVLLGVELDERGVQPAEDAEAEHAREQHELAWVHAGSADQCVDQGTRVLIVIRA